MPTGCSQSASVLYAVLFCVEMPIHALDSLNRHILMPFCMVFVIVTLFIARHGETSCFERILDYVGKRTLDIYVLHYFFSALLICKTWVNTWRNQAIVC